MCYFVQYFFNRLSKSLYLIILFQAVHTNAVITIDSSCGGPTGPVNQALHEALGMVYFASNMYHM